MTHFQVITIFPGLFESFLSEGLLGKALAQGKLQVDLIDLKSFGLGKHKKLDDTPYGGGAGMVLRIEPIHQALESIQALESSHKILITPQGTPLTQDKVVEFSKLEKPLCLVCGRFEGFDRRISDLMDEEISLGDFVLLGGEVAAMGIIEAVGRLEPEVIGNQSSLESESFTTGLLEYDQYTKPPEYEGKKVPDPLLSGNHQLIREWRLQNSLSKTRDRRPDLFAAYQQRK